MKKVTGILIFFCISCSVSKNNSTSLNYYEKFASIQGNEYKILIDTIAFKDKLKTLIDSSKHVSFNNIKIIKQKTLGSENKFVYYVLANDNKYNLKVAKWLRREGNKLLIQNNPDFFGFEQTYLICVGIYDCSPQIFIKEKKYSWSCSTYDEGCSLESKTNCKSFTSFFLD